MISKIRPQCLVRLTSLRQPQSVWCCLSVLVDGQDRHMTEARSASLQLGALRESPYSKSIKASRAGYLECRERTLVVVHDCTLSMMNVILPGAQGG